MIQNQYDDIIDAEDGGANKLLFASFGDRFVAKIVDGIFGMIILFGLFYLLLHLNVFSASMPMLDNLGPNAALFIVF